MINWVLKDISRDKYWKDNNYGYTEKIGEARLFSYKEAKEKVNSPGTKDLLILPFNETMENDILKLYDKTYCELDRTFRYKMTRYFMTNKAIPDTCVVPAWLAEKLTGKNLVDLLIFEKPTYLGVELILSDENIGWYFFRKLI
ncbi:MAG: hypothetical protein ACRDD7_03745 [Peptostreptococcaceae bacterium]